MTLDENPFVLTELLNELIDLFQLRAEKKGLYLLFDRAPDVPQMIQGDEVKLRQVLINLLGNALKFTEKGEVTLQIASVTNAEAEEAKFHIVDLKFTIADTGPGMTVEEQEHLFEAFVQTASGREASEGTGLGLALSQRFVRLMGGTIQVDSRPGQGATFSFTIPVKTLEASTHLQESSSRPVVALEEGHPGYRILLADHNAENRQFLCGLLQPLGFQLREAVNGKDAIEAWAEWQPDVVCMGLMMPVMNGYEALQYIRDAEAGSVSQRRTIIIALTASAFGEERQTALAKGFDDFLRKPFKVHDFFELIRKYLDVKYIYGDEPETQSPAFDEPVSREALKKIPATLLQQLEHAAGTTDIMQVSTIIREIRQYDAGLATRLQSFADDFDYEKILNAIDMPQRPM